VVLDGALADAKVGGDILAALSGEDELKNLTLTR